MKKEPTKTTEAQLLALLKQVLPKATPDPKLAGRIYQAIELELKTKAKAVAFDKFCAKVALPNLDPKSITEVKQQLVASFGEGDITVKPDRKEKTLVVEVDLPDGTQFTGEIKVNPNATNEADDEQEVPLKFVPLPVSLPGDPELVWVLGRHENLTADEAAIVLAAVEEDFWGSKAGQKLIRDRVDRCFPEFVARVPAGMLTERGLKRHYKEPEPVKLLRQALQR